MKVLFITPANTIGGAELSLLETIKFLRKHQVESLVALPEKEGDPLGKKLKEVAEVYYIPPSAWPRKSSLRGLKFELRRRLNEKKAVALVEEIIDREEPDLIHTNTVHARAGMIAARKKGTPHVLHLREITGNSEESYVSIYEQKDPAAFRNKWGHHDVLLANSQYCLEMNKNYFEGEKEQVIYNPVLPFPKLKKEEVNSIGLVANVTSRGKKHLEYIEIAKAYFDKNPDSKMEFLIYGKLPNESDPYYTSLLNKIKEYQLEGKVLFMGTMSGKDIYSKIDVLIHTFPFEAFGRIYIEAMSAGIPVLAASGGGASELITHQKDGLLYESGQVFEAVKQLENLIKDPELRNRISDMGLESSKKFHPDKVLEALPDIYEKAINAKN